MKNDDVPMRVKRQRAVAMRALSDDQRDELIAAAGRVVIDARARFNDIQKQVALQQEYRKPAKPTGVA